MRLIERINDLGKKISYGMYTKILPKSFKQYDKVTCKKMSEQILEFYQDPQNIINLCTEKELRFLQLLTGKEDYYWKLEDDFYNEHYWEIHLLSEKFIICLFDDNSIVIHDELIAVTKRVFKIIDWQAKQELDRMNEILVSLCKVHGIISTNRLADKGSQLLNIDEDDVFDHITSDGVFQYYVCFDIEDDKHCLAEDDEGDWVCIYREYFYMKDKIYKAINEFNFGAWRILVMEAYRNIFYFDFDIDDPKIAKVVDRIKKDQIANIIVRNDMLETALLNYPRDELKSSANTFLKLTDDEHDDFMQAIDEAMDEMPSGALNGFTVKQVREIEQSEKIFRQQNLKKNVKQRNAHLSKKDSELFNKIFTALLEYTNTKYRMHPLIKIYENPYLNPNDIAPIIEKFWDNKNVVITEFYLKNPYKLSNYELKLATQFKNSIHSNFYLSRFYQDYTAYIDLEDDKVYMVKSVGSNTDKYIDIEDLPYMVETTLIPFNGYIVFDKLDPLSVKSSVFVFEYQRIDKLLSDANFIYKL